MPVSLVGKKCGMTRVFTPDGASHPVTVLEIPVNRVVKLIDSDYRAIQVTAFSKQTKNMSKAEQGHFAAADVAAGEILQEIRLTEKELPEVKQGDELSVTLFAEDELVDVTGVTRGCGFQGGIKRWNFSMQDATHGNSLSHRANGSIGQCQTPGRVFKGKKMSGQMGNVRRTIQSQRIIRVDEERGLILVKGGVPGAPGGLITIKKAVKARNIEG